MICHSALANHDMIKEQSERPTFLALVATRTILIMVSQEGSASPSRTTVTICLSSMSAFVKEHGQQSLTRRADDVVVMNVAKDKVQSRPQRVSLTWARVPCLESDGKRDRDHLEEGAVR